MRCHEIGLNDREKNISQNIGDLNTDFAFYLCVYGVSYLSQIRDKSQPRRIYGRDFVGFAVLQWKWCMEASYKEKAL